MTWYENCIRFKTKTKRNETYQQKIDGKGHYHGGQIFLPIQSCIRLTKVYNEHSSRVRFDEDNT